MRKFFLNGRSFVIISSMLCLLSLFMLNGQTYTLEVSFASATKGITKTFPDTIQMLRYVEELVQEEMLSGYAEIQCRCMESTPLKKNCHIDRGKKYRLELSVVQDSAAHKFYSSRKTGTISYFPAGIRKTLRQWTDEGYPFARLEIISLEKQDNVLRGIASVNAGPAVKIDSLINKGTIDIKKKVLQRISGIMPGDIFSFSGFMKINSRINQSGFMMTHQDPQLRYHSGKMKVIVFPGNLPSSRFDAIMGLQPDPQNNKTVLTGNVSVHLKNALMHHAEDISIEWRRIKIQTQEFNGGFKIPYVFGTIIGTEGRFSLYRQDSTFLDVWWEGALHFYMGGMNSLRIYTSRRINTGLSNSFLGTGQGESKTTTGGIGINLENTDFSVNPRKGWVVKVQAGSGNRKIRSPIALTTVPETPSSSGSSFYLESRGTVQRFFPIGKQSCVMEGIRWAGASSSVPLLPSELFRSGGFQTWRGFDENNFLSSVYAVHTLEYRFLFSTLSHVQLFADFGWYERLLSGSYLSHFAAGYGAGLQLETKGGVFRMAYALGHLIGQKPDVRTGKIHVGFVSVFR